MKIQAFVPKHFAILNGSEKNGIVDIEFEISSLNQDQREILSRFIPESLIEKYRDYDRIPSEFQKFIDRKNFLLKLKSATFESLIETIKEIGIIDKKLKKEKEKREEKERRQAEFIEQFSKAIVEIGILETGEVEFKNERIQLLEKTERIHHTKGVKIDYIEWNCKHNIWYEKNSENPENAILVYKYDLSKNAKERITKELNLRNLKEQKIRDEKMAVFIEKEKEREKEENEKWGILLAKVLTDEQRERYSEGFLSQKELDDQIRNVVFRELDDSFFRYSKLTHLDLQHGKNCNCDEYDSDLEELAEYFVDSDDLSLTKEQYKILKEIRKLSNTIVEKFGGEMEVIPRMHYGKLECSDREAERLGIKVQWKMNTGKSLSREYGLQF